MSDPWDTAANPQTKPPSQSGPSLQDTFDWLLNNLDQVDEVGNTGEYRANCPLCQDTGQHLYFRIDTDKILLHCHHGCDWHNILAKLGLPQTYLFQGNRQASNAPPVHQHVVATYTYTDEQGIQLHRTVKMGPTKRFFQEHWDGKKWVKGLGKVRRVLYNLVALDNSKPGDQVFLCEGEKSADAIIGLGALATTNAMGAGNWRMEYNEMLRGKHVVILPDNDDAGWEHVRVVGRELQGKASSARVLGLPMLRYKAKGGDDPWDWVDRGGTLAELIKLTITAPLLNAQSKRIMSSEYMSALAVLGYHFRLNICTDRTEVNQEPLSDVKAAEIRARMRDFGFERATRFEDAYTAAALANPYHPVQAYLDNLAWDSKDHIGKLASHFPDLHNAFPMFLRRWLIGAVAKTYTVAQNRMLVLDGPQDVGKSYFAKWLCSPLSKLFVEGPIDPDNKDHHIRLIKSWIWEVAELGSTTRRADQEALKHFLTVRQVTVRKPYGKYDMIKPALASFIGTVNNEAGVLSDPTGHRRFMVIHLVDIDWKYESVVSVDQMWAQAKALFDAGETWKLEGAELDLANTTNEEYEIEDPLVSYILQRFEITGDRLDKVSTAQILKELHIDGWRLRTPRSESMALATIFKTEDRFKGQVIPYSDGQQRGYDGLEVKDRLTTP